MKLSEMEHFDYTSNEFMMINNAIMSPQYINTKESNPRQLSPTCKVSENTNLEFGTFLKSDESNLNPIGITSYPDVYTRRNNIGVGYANDALPDIIIPTVDSSTLPSIYVTKEISQPILSNGSNPRSLLEGISSYEENQMSSDKSTNDFENERNVYEFAREVFETDDLYETSFGSASTIWSIDNNKLGNTDDNGKAADNYLYNQNEYNDQMTITNSKSSSIESLTMNEYNDGKRAKYSSPELKQESFLTEEIVSMRGKRSLEIKPKLIPDRFKLTSNSFIKLTIVESSIQCLSIMFDYHGYTGRPIGVPIMNNNLKNEAINPNAKQSTDVKLIEPIKTDPHAIQPPPTSTLWQRVKYSRDISDLQDTITNIVYKKSSIYDFNNPYEPQYYRFELDEFGDLINESKCGMCAYCEKVKFLPFKNSSYLSHLTLEHGIFSNNYLTPEGVCYGRYLFTKNSNIYDSDTTPNSESPEENNSNIIKKKALQKPRVTEALACPACFEIIEVGCWKMKSNPLLSYFRHFKKHHKNLTNQRANFQTNPLLTISKRGRKLQVLDS